MLDLAKQEGGRRLDAFDTVLPHIYAQNGFRTVARLPWNEDYKPEGWNHDAFKQFKGGRPDVVFMAHDPQAGAYNPGDGRTVSDYDEGTAAQHAALAHVAARGNVPAAPGPESYGSGQLIRMSDPQTVWHGTQHEFKPTRVNQLGEFDLSKMSSGEGGQMYGHGAYTGGARGTGEAYRKNLAEGAKYKGQSDPMGLSGHDYNAAREVLDTIHEHGMAPQQAIEHVRQTHEQEAANAFSKPQSHVWQSWQEAGHRSAGIADAVQRLKLEDFTHNPGHLYEAELHIDQDHMLHWDHPIGQQHPYVQSRAIPLAPSASIGSKMTGQMLHDYLTGGDKTRRPIAAEKLLNAGIPGIKYVDQDSRLTDVGPYTTGDGKRAWAVFHRNNNFPLATFNTKEEAQAHLEAHHRTHNYVVFDPRTINIVKRNGLPAMVDAGADALRDHKATG
jgi:hypothetical protein